jgi:hypothetical protein
VWARIANPRYRLQKKILHIRAIGYAMRTLYLLGNHYNWILPELKTIITKDYPNHSSAYKAVAKEVLKKIK